MNKTLQTTVWSCLPKEFKEEVKKYYHTLHEQYLDYAGLHLENTKAKVKERIVTLEYFFGIDNLTSDAEGEEEMLYVSRKRVQELYNRYFGNPLEPVSKIRLRKDFQDLFGSKCLPDELNEDNFAKSESQYHIGDKVEVIGYDYGLPSLGRCIGKVFTVSDVKYDANQWMYKLETDEWLFDERDYLKSILWCEHFLKPYEEPKPAKPKYHKGDKVLVKPYGWIGVIDSYNPVIGDYRILAENTEVSAFFKKRNPTSNPTPRRAKKNQPLFVPNP